MLGHQFELRETIAALGICVVLSDGALAQSAAGSVGSPGVTAACVAAARAVADSTPTSFKCDWKRAAEGRKPGGLTGRNTLTTRGLTGDLAIIEQDAGRAWMAIETVSTAQAHTCQLALEARRRKPGEPAGTPVDVPACTVRVTRSNFGAVRVSSAGCQHFCGLSGRLDGVYRPARR
jgi:hypothetical protein